MMEKSSKAMNILYVVIFACFVLSNLVLAQFTEGAKEQKIPRYVYAHIGLGGNMYEVSSDNMNSVIDPFQVATPIRFSHYFFLNSGFRNIFQVEYRWGKDKNNLFYDETTFPPGMTIQRNSIDTRFDYSQFLFKLNPLFFIPKLNAWAFFLLWGKGEVDYVDSNGDGFQDGTKKTVGLEISKILKYFELSGSFEKNSMVFKKFDVEGFQPLVKDFDASYWQFNIKVSVGFGI